MPDSVKPLAAAKDVTDATPDDAADAATSALSELDVYLLRRGQHGRLYRHFGAHAETRGGRSGTRFAVWAPNARRVSVIGDFNGWDPQPHPLHPRNDQSGIWEGYVVGVEPGVRYKYRIESAAGGTFDKADPFARRTETPPSTASVVAREARPDDEATGGHLWQDDEWMARRAETDPLSSPSSTYEMHLGSWRRAGEHGEEFLGYRDLAEPLGDYLVDMGYTHVEFLPLTEHPFYGSWGYQCTGFFAPTARYGSPDDLKYLIDALHARGIGVILDWVPSHFPGDAYGLYRFDGTALYEHEDPRQGYHPDWSSWIFNYGRDEVASFLLSSALYWLEEFHVDGLRVDAVASMLYLDYSRKEGEWIPNVHGGRENLEAIAFLRHLNEAVYRDHPGARMIAEESTAWPMVSRPTYVGGLGFGQKWNMGWMHDTLAYFREDPVNRKYHQGQLTFSLVYAFSEHFVLSLSHDEVVHGKGSLVNKMPGDEWQKFANLRAMYGYMFGHPGKKLVFMGGEFGQYREWSHDRSLDWHLLLEIPHQGLQHWCRDLNHLYRSEPALFERDSDPEGFRWVDADDVERSTLSFLRFALDGEAVLVACNFTPMPREGVRLGVPAGGYWRELLNSDARIYGGSGVGNAGGVESERVGAHGFEHSISVVLPPLSVTYFKVAPEGAPSTER